MPTFVAVLATSFALATPHALAANCPGADVTAAAASVDAVRGATLCLLNEQRAAHGLTPLTSQPLLDSAATTFSRAIVEQHFWAHVSPAGEDLQQRLNPYIGQAQAWDVGENIGWATGSSATPGAIVDGWMNSDGHRKNVLNATFREVGIGVVPGTYLGHPPEDSATFTAEFGARLTATPGPSTAQRPSAYPTAGPASTPTAGASDPMTHAPGAKPSKKVSAAKKRAIQARCTTIARRTRSSKAARKARIATCVRVALRAAARR